MIFAEIQHGSPEYQQECELRHAVLRVPLGLSLHDEDLADEVHQHHFGLFLAEGTLVACAIAVAIFPAEIKIRQMAVRQDHQRRGYGGTLLIRLLSHLDESGFREVFLHARAEVTGFYESAGFTCSGTRFTEVGIPHVRMSRAI